MLIVLLVRSTGFISKMIVSLIALVLCLQTRGLAQGSGWTYNKNSINAARCAQDRLVAASIEKQLESLSAQRDDPLNTGPASTIYLGRMRVLSAQAAAIATDERTVCDGYTYTGIPNPPGVSVISPFLNDGIKDKGPSPSGLTIALAGNPSALYAVSLNAGVWKSVAGSTWTRLRASPRYAHSIAVDPNNAKHVVVGERAGDAVIPEQDHAGLWESLDAGITWKYVFDPLSQPACTSQAVPSVVFDRASNLFLATTCGIAHRAQGSSTFSFSGNPSGIGAVTAVTASETKIWGRTQTQLLVPQTDKSWKAVAMPSNMQPSGGNTPAHDEFALAAFDVAAYFPCCDDLSLQKHKCGNLDDLVIFRAQAASFAFVPNTKDGKPLFGCSGQGLGGSRFVKAYFSGNTQNPSLVKTILYSSTEEVYESTTVASDGSISNWTRPLGASCPGCTNQDPVHSDIWDFLISPDRSMEWVANDGGVYQRSLVPSGHWTLHDAGLATHHAHTLTVVGTGASTRLLYPTSDNDAWFSTKSNWAREDEIGDVNWSWGDAANPNIALAERRTGSCVGQVCAVLTGFGQSLPDGGSLPRAQLSNDSNRDGPEFFTFVQSLASEIPTKFELDAVMMATLPLQYADKNGLHDVPGPLGVSAGALRGSVVLLRNPDFAKNPDIDKSKGKGWSLFASNLPAGASRFWIGRGHAAPVVYVMTASGTSDPRLFRALALPVGSDGKPTGWTELNVRGDLLQARPWPRSGILDGSDVYGPVFVNPYNSLELYVLTDSGIVVSENGGVSFNPDITLTKLIIGGGKYPLIGNFAGANSSNIKIGSRANSMGSLADVTFDRSNPRIAVAASPFTGLFFKDESGSWFDLSPFLPVPFPIVSDARLDGDTIYVSTEGGGIFEITEYRELVKTLTADRP